MDQRHLQQGFAEEMGSIGSDPRDKKTERKDGNRHSIYDSPSDFIIDSNRVGSVASRSGKPEDKEVDLEASETDGEGIFSGKKFSGKLHRMKVTAVPSPGTDVDAKPAVQRTNSSTRGDNQKLAGKFYNATPASSEAPGAATTKSKRSASRTPSIAVARPPHTPYTGVRESYEELVDVNTVPMAVQREFEAEYLATMDDFNKDELPPDVERWTVKLPTRLEFKNVTIRVMKPKPTKEKEVDLVCHVIFHISSVT